MAGGSRVELRLGRSPMLATALMAGHGGAGVLLAACALPLWLRATVLLALAASAIYHLRGSALRLGPGALQGVRLDLDGRCAVDRGRGWEEATLAPRCFVSPWLVLAAAVPAGARLPCALVIPADAVDAADFRRLRVLLRWGSGSPG